MNPDLMNQFTNDASIAMYMGIFWTVAMIINILYLLLTWWGLYMINKKLWEPHAWLSFIPMINIYSYVRASWKENIWILWIILWTFSLMIPIIWLIIFFTLIIKLLHSISKRCSRWAWTTIGFLFIPLIMFPIVWYKLKSNEDNQNNVDIEL